MRPPSVDIYKKKWWFNHNVMSNRDFDSGSQRVNHSKAFRDRKVIANEKKE